MGFAISLFCFIQEIEIMNIPKTHLQKDAINLFNEYKSRNNDDIYRTLIELKNNNKDEFYFSEYFYTHEAFLKACNIPVDVFREANFMGWIGSQKYFDY